MGTDSVPIGATAIKPVERHGWEAVSWFLYDRNTGAIMGRTPMSWLLITVFYIIYYTLLAGFWMLCLTIFFQFVDDHQPRWQQDGSLIGSSPALGENQISECNKDFSISLNANILIAKRNFGEK